MSRIACGEKSKTYCNMAQTQTTLLSKASDTSTTLSARFFAYALQVCLESTIASLRGQALTRLCKATIIPREAACDLVIQGIPIEKGTTLMIMPDVIHKNPLVWGEDVEDFNPDRWDNLSAEAADAYAFASFSNGPRVS